METCPSRIEHPNPDARAPEPTRSDAGGEAGRPPQILGKRRRFLIHRASQMRAALIVTGLAFLLVLQLNISLHSARVQATAAVAGDAPQFAALLEAQGRFELILGIAASAVLLAGIFVVTILETHKTAGAAFHVARVLERVRDGYYGERLKLRKGDNLRNVEAAFNEMTRSLAERAAVEAEELDHMASEAGRVSSVAEAHDLAAVLRGMADERRGLTAAAHDPRG